MDSLELKQDARLARTVARSFAAKYPFVCEDDLTQEGMLKARRLREAHDPARGNIDAFLRRGVMNVCYDIIRQELRRLRHTRPLDEKTNGDAPCSSAPSALHALVTREDARRLRAAVSMLPLEQRTVIELTLEDADVEDLMQATGKSRDAVYSARSHAFTRLRHMLADAPAPA